MIRRFLCWLGFHPKPKSKMTVGWWCPSCRAVVWAKKEARPR